MPDDINEEDAPCDGTYVDTVYRSGFDQCDTTWTHQHPDNNPKSHSLTRNEGAYVIGCKTDLIHIHIICPSHFEVNAPDVAKQRVFHAIIKT